MFCLSFLPAHLLAAKFQVDNTTHTRLLGKEFCSDGWWKPVEVCHQQ
jgi:hypothetical protein